MLLPEGASIERVELELVSPDTVLAEWTPYRYFSFVNHDSCTLFVADKDMFASKAIEESAIKHSIEIRRQIDDLMFFKFMLKFLL